MIFIKSIPVPRRDGVSDCRNFKRSSYFCYGERLNLGIHNHIYEESRMATKKQTLLYIDIEVTKKAKDLGLNLSKVSENALKEAICRLEGMNSETGCQDDTHCNENAGHWWRGWDLNPRRPAPEDLKSSSIS